ncbi:MAG: hypothetical protein A2X47_06360 [Lentisphaerae bacterium GWF2_38_69]|nr:MAG: hypothetical protein A2X47_06360 [Lentisphaerae bacterium GWF2_38_69]
MNRKNFTIIELLAVFVVIAILIGITIGVYSLVWEKMKNSKTRAIVKQLDIALQSYKIDQGYYFTNTTSYANPPSDNNRFKFDYGVTNKDKDFIKCFEYQSLVGSGNIKAQGTSYEYIVDAWANPLLYKCPGEFNPEMFDIGSLGKDGKYGSNSDDPNDFGQGDDITNFNNN